MRIAVEGCCHGELDKIYETLEHLQKKEGFKVDMLLCCGDFQAVRNESDLCCMAVPPKYRNMQTFYKYYSGEKKAPVLTIFIGGNHEATNHLWELPYGGWVAPNIYYMGYSGVVTFGGIRIAGLSGIYKSHDYHKGHFERPPYDNGTVRSAYHIRSVDVFKLKLLTGPIDIFVSHDWPLGVYHHGNVEELYRYKDYLRAEIEANTLGSPPAAELMSLLKPKYWFSAHMHTKFPALVPHNCSDGVKFTKFLALDKCLPRRQFLQVVDFGPTDAPSELFYDPEWLAITQLTDALNNGTSCVTVLPNFEEASKFKIDKEAIIKEAFHKFGNPPKVPDNFVLTSPPFNSLETSKTKMHQVLPIINPQTEAFCTKLGIKNPCYSEEQSMQAYGNPEVIELSDEGNDEDDDDTNDYFNKPGEFKGLDIDEEADDKNDDDVTECESSSEKLVKTIRRPHLQLPKPTNSCLENVTSIMPQTVVEKSDWVMSEQTKDACTTLEPQRKVMKLKRRNQSIYVSSDNTEDSDES